MQSDNRKVLVISHFENKIIPNQKIHLEMKIDSRKHMEAAR